MWRARPERARSSKSGSEIAASRSRMPNTHFLFQNRVQEHGLRLRVDIPRPRISTLRQTCRDRGGSGHFVRGNRLFLVDDDGTSRACCLDSMCGDGLLWRVGQVVYVSDGVNFSGLVFKHNPVSIEAEFVDNLGAPRDGDFALKSSIGSSKVNRRAPLRTSSSVNSHRLPHG